VKVMCVLRLKCDFSLTAEWCVNSMNMYSMYDMATTVYGLLLIGLIKANLYL